MKLASGYGNYFVCPADGCVFPLKLCAYLRAKSITFIIYPIYGYYRNPTKNYIYHRANRNTEVLNTHTGLSVASPGMWACLPEPITDPETHSLRDKRLQNRIMKKLLEEKPTTWFEPLRNTIDVIKMLVSGEIAFWETTFII